MIMENIPTEIPNLLVRVNGNTIEVKVGDYEAIEVAHEYTSYCGAGIDGPPGERVYTRGSVLPHGNSEANRCFLDECDRVGLPGPFRKRLYVTMTNALFFSGMADSEENKLKTLAMIRYQWIHDEKWDIEDRQWAGLEPANLSTRWE